MRHAALQKCIKITSLVFAIWSTIVFVLPNFVWRIYLLHEITLRTYRFGKFTSKDMTLKYGRFSWITMTTSECKTELLHAICRSSGTEKDTVDPVGRYVSVGHRVKYPRRQQNQGNDMFCFTSVLQNYCITIHALSVIIEE